MTAPQTLALFDLDKTLVRSDSFRLFASLGASGPMQRLWFLALAVLAKLRVISNRRYKELVIDAVWSTTDPSSRERLVDAQVAAMNAMLMTPVVAALRHHLAAGDAVAIVTASPAIYVSAFAAELDARVDVLASALDPGRDGAALTNLYGPAKAEAAAALIDRHHGAAVHVYTDHAHDLALMRLADEVTLVDPGPATIKIVKESGIDPAILR